MSERTPMEALRSALRFAASRSCITSAEELAIMDAWNNTRPQPSAEPVAVWREALAAFSTFPMPFGNSQAAAAVIASALEAARREALEQAAKVAESWDGPRVTVSRLRGVLATAIRALKENTNG